MHVNDKTKALAKAILNYWKVTERHNQEHWILDNDADILEREVNGKTVHFCDTTMCAAGTAVFLSNTPQAFKNFARVASRDADSWFNEGRALLGLTSDEARSLFYADNDTAVNLMTAIANGDQAEFDRVVDEDYVRV